MKYSTLRTALLLLTTATVSTAQVDDILANTGKFKPRITVSDHYSERVLVEVDDGSIFRSVEPNPERIAITVVANLDGAEIGAIDAETTVGIIAGYFDHTAVLGEAENFRPTAKRATFPLRKEVDLPNGDTRQVSVGSVTYAWTEKTVTITVTCSDIAGAEVAEIAASDYAGGAEPGIPFSFSGDAIDVVVMFGDATGTRRAFLKGITRTVTRGFGSIAAETYEELDLIDVNLHGAADVAGPAVQATFPIKPNATHAIDIAGTAEDLTIVGLDSITVNGVGVTPASLGSEDSADGVWNWSVGGLQLAKGRNVVVLSFSDEDGNVTKVTRTYTIR